MDDNYDDFQDIDEGQIENHDLRDMKKSKISSRNLNFVV